MREYINLNKIQHLDCEKCGRTFSNESNNFNIIYFSATEIDAPIVMDERLEVKCPTCGYHIKFKTKNSTNE